MRPDGLPDDAELDAILARIDHPVPDVSARDVMARARRRGAPTLRRAAAIVGALAVVGGAAYAAPGSPVRGWVRDVARGLGWTDDIPALAAPPQVPGGATAAGIALAPGERMVIRFAAEGATGAVRVAVGGGQDVDIRSMSPTTTFASEPDRLLVDHLTSDTVQVLLPRTSTHLEIQVGDRSVLIQEGTTVSTSAARDAFGAWLIPLGPGDR
jgi:hypothetical protein